MTSDILRAFLFIVLDLYIHVNINKEPGFRGPAVYLPFSKREVLED